MARVFDLTAPKLLLAAAHLVKDANAAEDLVQSTFLSAIEKAEHYDSALPLLPWLMGILANRVRYLRRQESRSLRGVPARREPADPATQIADEELMQRVSSAMDGLPMLYRPVLTLRLVHGLMRALHWPLFALALSAPLLLWVRSRSHGFEVGQRALLVSVLAFGYLLGALWFVAWLPRYTIPARPLSYVLVAAALSLAYGWFRERGRPAC